MHYSSNTKGAVPGAGFGAGSKGANLGCVWVKSLEQEGAHDGLVWDSA